MSDELKFEWYWAIRDADGYESCVYIISRKLFGWTLGPRIDDLLRAVNGPVGVGWKEIETAPQDGRPVWVYVAMAHGLPPFEDKCSWHPDAGWCADELRPVTQGRVATSPALPAI